MSYAKNDPSLAFQVAGTLAGHHRSEGLDLFQFPSTWRDSYADAPPCRRARHLPRWSSITITHQPAHGPSSFKLHKQSHSLLRSSSECNLWGFYRKHRKAIYSKGQPVHPGLHVRPSQSQAEASGYPRSHLPAGPLSRPMAPATGLAICSHLSAHSSIFVVYTGAGSNPAASSSRFLVPHFLSSKVVAERR